MTKLSDRLLVLSQLPVLAMGWLLHGALVHYPDPRVRLAHWMTRVFPFLTSHLESFSTRAVLLGNTTDA